MSKTVTVELTVADSRWLIVRVGAGVALETTRDRDVRSRVYRALAKALGVAAEQEVNE